jgi:hypothetical protein
MSMDFVPKIRCTRCEFETIRDREGIPEMHIHYSWEHHTVNGEKYHMWSLDEMLKENPDFKNAIDEFRNEAEKYQLCGRCKHFNSPKMNAFGQCSLGTFKRKVKILEDCDKFERKEE